MAECSLFGLHLRRVYKMNNSPRSEEGEKEGARLREASESKL